MVINRSFWQGKRVLLTGHTGFKGSWLALWLQQLGAEVTGVSLPAPTDPGLFKVANVEEGITSIYGDIRELATLKRTFLAVNPDVVIHLAAQSLVRYSYQKPIETYQTNVMGSLHVLEAVRDCKNVRAVVMVTTDKCYENKEWIWPYRENDPMGGHDPYSSSKGCAELLVASYRKSFFANKNSAAIATARAGNVIAGGDWASDRLIPDIIKAFQNQQTVRIRNPNSIRPWQHVLEPLSGYLILAEKLYTHGHEFAGPWNFGPKTEDMQPVQRIVTMIAKYFTDAQWQQDDSENVHESHCLKLDSSKAADKLAWQPTWCLQQSIQKTVEWYRAEQQGMNMRKFCQEQIKAFEIYTSMALN